MAKFSVSISGDLDAGLKKFLSAASNKLLEREKEIAIQLTNKVLALTPVWEGTTLVNWHWSVGSPVFERASPLGQDIDPGPTNSMPLGSEPRRAINTAPPMQSLMAVLQAMEPVDLYLTNAADSAIDVEYGLFPTPERSRSPRGVLRLAIKEITGKLR